MIVYALVCMCVYIYVCTYGYVCVLLLLVVYCLLFFFVVFLHLSPVAVCFEDRIERCCLELASALENLNNQLKKKVEDQLNKAVDNLSGYIRYQFFESHGPKWGRVTKDHPLFPRFI